jgi:hypothetical protein
MTDQQIASLKQIYGDFEIITANKTFLDANEIINFAHNVDVYAAVLPTEILISLFKTIPTDKDLIIPCSKRLPTGNKIFNPATNEHEQEYMFAHDRWKKVIYAEFETQDLI